MKGQIRNVVKGRYKAEEEREGGMEKEYREWKTRGAEKREGRGKKKTEG